MAAKKAQINKEAKMEYTKYSTQTNSDNSNLPPKWAYLVQSNKTN